MATEFHRVAIVVDPNFGDRLIALSRRLHVWVCDTPANRAVASSIWGNDPTYDLESGITTFHFAADSSAAEIVDAVLGDVDLHHGANSHDPPWSVIKVIGCSPTEALTAAFSSFGAEIVSTAPDVFEARRIVGTEA
jgi:hypothetical protein